MIGTTQLSCRGDTRDGNILIREMNVLEPNPDLGAVLAGQSSCAAASWRRRTMTSVKSSTRKTTTRSSASATQITPFWAMSKTLLTMSPAVTWIR